MTVTVRDLEATFRKLGFSSRRSKAGAAAAFKAMAVEEESDAAEDEATATLKDFAAQLAAHLGTRNV